MRNPRQRSWHGPVFAGPIAARLGTIVGRQGFGWPVLPSWGKRCRWLVGCQPIAAGPTTPLSCVRVCLPPKLALHLASPPQRYNNTPPCCTYQTNPSLRRVALHVVARLFDSRRYHRHPRLQGSRPRTLLFQIHSPRWWWVPLFRFLLLVPFRSGCCCGGLRSLKPHVCNPAPRLADSGVVVKARTVHPLCL
jgi:hypothetical protein